MLRTHISPFAPRGISAVGYALSMVQPPSFSWEDLDDLSLLATDTPWSQFLPALREISGETFEVQGPVEDWLAFVRRWDQTASGRTWYLVGGDYQGRSYALVGIGTLANPD